MVFFFSSVVPYWITEPEDIEAAEEEDVIIDCEAMGIPSPHITWYMNGDIIPGKYISIKECIMSHELKCRPTHEWGIYTL